MCLPVVADLFFNAHPITADTNKYLHKLVLLLFNLCKYPMVTAEGPLLECKKLIYCHETTDLEHITVCIMLELLLMLDQLDQWIVVENIFED